jgi:hypothetical protein
MGKKLSIPLLDQFVTYILDQHKSGVMERSVALGNLTHLVIAIARGDDESAADPERFMRGVLSGDHG